MKQEEYRALCEELNTIDRQYCGSVQEIYEEGLRQVVRRQYARGGCTLQRGYYCPSPVLDIIAGNKDRGRLLKKLSGKQPDYMYGFSEAGELLIIDGPWSALTNGPYYREVLLRDSEREIGLRFQEVFGKTELCGISICDTQKGRPVRYLYALVRDPVTGTFTEFDMEVYTYEGERLITAVHYRYGNNARAGGLVGNEMICRFAHDANGNLSTYTVQPIDQLNGERKIRPLRSYQVQQSGRT